MIQRSQFFWFFIFSLVLFVSPVVIGHALQSTLISVSLISDTEAEVVLNPGLSVQVDGDSLHLETEEGCSALSTGSGIDYGRQYGWLLICDSGFPETMRFGFSGAELDGVGLIFRYRLQGQEQWTVKTGLYNDFHLSTTPSNSYEASFYTFVVLGMTHLITGLDHLLFLVGLVFLVSTRRTLVIAITGFTLGHSLTLGLVLTQQWFISPRAVESVIALSLLFLAIELIKPSSQSIMRRWPGFMSVLFGLIHGLGFSGALREIGLTQEELVWPLLSFNCGIEVAQLGVVLPVLLTKEWIERNLEGNHLVFRIAVICAYGMGSIAVYWLFERITAV
jgi:hydrogenase/urease accessory protein HupE